MIMKWFSRCCGKCGICAIGKGCIAGHGDDDYVPASKETVIDRLDKGEYPSSRKEMIEYLKNKFDNMHTD